MGIELRDDGIEERQLQEKDFAKMAINKIFIRSLQLISQASTMAKKSADPTMRNYYNNKIQEHHNVIFREIYNYDYDRSYMHLIRQDLMDREPREWLTGK